MIAPSPIDETERLKALRQYEVLDTNPEQEFDDLTHLAALICGTPYSAITLVDKDRQWFKSQHGLGITETSRDVSFCSHTILEEGIFIVPDASYDERFAENPFVASEAHIRFYAGVPLVSPEGHAVGALCVIDTVPRELNSDQQDALIRLGHQAVSLLESRPEEAEQHKTRLERQQARREQLALADAKVQQDAEELKASEIRYRRLFEAAKDGILILDAATGQIEDVNPFLCQLLGYDCSEFTGKKLWEIAAFQNVAATPSEFRSLRMSEYLRHDDLELESKTGQKVFVDFVSNVYECAGKKVIQCNLRDISAEKQAVTEQERFFSLALDMLCILDMDGTFKRVNPALERVLGFAPDEMLGKQCIDFVHPDDWVASKEAMAQLAEGQSVINFVNRFRCRDNSYKSILWVTTPYEEQIYAAGRDITNHIQAEEAAQASQRFLQATLDSLSEQIAVLDENGTILAVNKAWLSPIAGVDEEVISACGVGVNYIEVCDKAKGDSSDEATDVAQGIRDVMAGHQQVFSLEYPCHSSDEQRWFNVCVTRFINNGLVHAVVAHEDISKRKRAEIALHKSNDELELHVMERTYQLVKANEQLESELIERRRTGRELQQAQQMLQLVMNHIPQAIFWKDQSSTFLGCNHRFALDAGYSSPEEVKGKNDFDMPSAEYAVDYITDDRFVMETDTPKLNIEEKLFKADGSKVWLRTSKIPLHDNDDNVVGVLCSYEDITEWKNAESSLIEARQEADAANHAKSEFLSRMSHELRTPLNAILGFGQILDKAELPVHLKESVGYILKGGWHLLDLINEVLDIARVEAGRLELALEPVLLSEIVSETCSMMRPLASERRIYVEEDTFRYGSRYIMADPQRLKQVLLNLIGNAIKYNRDGGLVTVSCQQSSTGWITIKVRDTGQGIASHDLPKLFSPFERLNATSTKIEGTGLGLVLSQRLMEAMGGTLKVESTYGVGTTFTVELEQAELPEELAVNVPDVVPLVFSKEAERSHTVLCIEDNPSNLRLTAGIFRLRPQWKLLAAMQGDIGLSMARQYETDLILLDLNLPEMDGREVLKTLRRAEATKNIPVVIISADATPNQVQQLLDDGAEAYLTKPLDVTVFLETLDKFLVRPAAKEE